MFRAVFPLIHQELKNSTSSIGCLSKFYAATANVGESDAACTVFELMMMSGKTARNMYSSDNKKEYCTRCILLVVLKNTLKMHYPMAVKFFRKSLVFPSSWQNNPLPRI